MGRLLPGRRAQLHEEHPARPREELRRGRRGFRPRAHPQRLLQLQPAGTGRHGRERHPLPHRRGLPHQAARGAHHLPEGELRGRHQRQALGRGRVRAHRLRRVDGRHVQLGPPVLADVELAPHGQPRHQLRRDGPLPAAVLPAVLVRRRGGEHHAHEEGAVRRHRGVQPGHGPDARRHDRHRAAALPPQLGRRDPEQRERAEHHRLARAGHERVRHLPRHPDARRHREHPRARRIDGRHGRARRGGPLHGLPDEGRLRQRAAQPREQLHGHPQRRRNRAARVDGPVRGGGRRDTRPVPRLPLKDQPGARVPREPCDAREHRRIGDLVPRADGLRRQLLLQDRAG